MLVMDANKQILSIIYFIFEKKGPT